jgi:hypothetical protein
MTDVFGFEEEKPKKTVYKPGLGKFDYKIHDGVTVTWLSECFKMDRRTVNRKLRNVKPIRKGKGAQPVYDFIEAAGHLVDPLYDMEDYISRLRSQDLPVQLQKDFWEAKNKKQMYQMRAGELWHTDDVVQCVSEMLSLVKENISLWATNVEEKSFLEQDQHEVLQQEIDSLQVLLIDKMQDLSEKSETKSSLYEREEDEEDDIFGEI